MAKIMRNYTYCYLKPMEINTQNLSQIFIKTREYISFLPTTKTMWNKNPCQYMVILSIL